MADEMAALERRMSELRGEVREAVLGGETELAAARRAELRRVERQWDDTLAAQASASAPGARTANSSSAPVARRQAPGGSLLPLREQVYEALSLLQVPAAPKLIATVHEAFFGSTFPTARVTSLKRDEERSFRSAPFARPYYVCAALSADYLSPSRGLLAVSTWPMESRVIGPLSPRVDFLTAAVHVADAIERIPTPPLTARQLLHRFAVNIPGAAPMPGEPASATLDQVKPDVVRQAAQAELAVHQQADSRLRKEAGARARRQLADAEQLFGTSAGMPDSAAVDVGRADTHDHPPAAE